MRRRDFIKAIAVSAVTWPLAARAQQSAIPVVGLLHGGSADDSVYRVAAFRAALADAGYVEAELGHRVSLGERAK
jgi:putative ABC transport system substrate-binding protein